MFDRVDRVIRDKYYTKCHSNVGISYSCQILLLYGAKTNKTLV